MNVRPVLYWTIVPADADAVYKTLVVYGEGREKKTGAERGRR